MSSAVAPACEGLRDGPKGTVTGIVDGDTLLLDTGLVVRLIGIQAPKLALGRDGHTDWPKGNEAKAALIALTYKKPVLLERGSFRPLTNPMLDMLERAQEKFVTEPALQGEVPVVQGVLLVAIAVVVVSGVVINLVIRRSTGTGRNAA